MSLPEAVVAAFNAKYAGAEEVRWGKESDNEFEAEFELNEKEMTASFDTSGKWMETEAKLSEEDLPAPILQTLKSQFGDYRIVQAESLEKAGETAVYEVKLEKGESELEVVLDASGKVVKKEQEK